MKRLFIAVLLILSVTTAFTQIVNKAEYFFDSDPGVGNGTAITISNPGISVSFPVSIPVNLSPGFHWLAIRVKDSDGKWSLFSKRSFFIAQPTTDLPIITAAEYFYDTDPGVGNGNSLTFQTSGFTVSQSFTIPVPSNMTAGNHFLAIRVKDQAGHWSLFQRDTIVVGASTATIACPGNVVVTAAAGQCSSIVNNIDAIVSPQGTAYTYSLTGATTGNGAGTASGKAFNVGVTTVKYALTDAPSTSCSFTVSVNSGTAASVNINPSSTTICSGQQVTFTATPVNGGNTPAYQWKLNGNNIAGASNSTYQTSSLANGDVVSVAMTSSITCASPASVTSNAITMTVNSSVSPSVSISASSSSICPGQTVTFTATPTNGGNPTYEWTLNNNAVGTNSSNYQNSALANGDVIKVTMSSSLSCASPNPVVSNGITMNVGTAPTPSVSITASAIDICAGTNVMFTATPVNGGSTPSYQWKLNGNNVGTNSATYQTSSLNNADTVRVVMTSSLSCVSSATATSNYISMDVTQPVTPSVNISATNTSICAGQSVTFTAAPTNGGSSPVYQWKINGVNAGTNSNTFQTASLSNGDIVSVALTSSLPCVTTATANSNTMSISVSQSVTYYRDLDGDGYGNSSSGTTQSCTPQTGYVTNNTDCNDNNAAVHPGATEICGNGVDDNCDGQIDEGCSSPDNDGDGYTIAQGDCNDNNAAIHPGAAEICGNGIDDDCDGQTDEGCTQNIPTLLTRTYPIKEGNTGFTILNAEVTLDTAASLPVSLKFKTINEDAIGGTDYESTSGTLLIPAGKTSGWVQVKVIGDLLRETNERFRINFSDPVNVQLPPDPNSRVMIIDDDKGKPNSASPNNDAVTEITAFKIPTVAKRNSIWMIPQIGNYENEVLIVNVQGQIVNRFINYKNQIAVGNVSAGLYFYRIRIDQGNGQYKVYSGKLLITE